MNEYRVTFYLEDDTDVAVNIEGDVDSLQEYLRDGLEGVSQWIYLGPASINKSKLLATKTELAKRR